MKLNIKCEITIGNGAVVSLSEKQQRAVERFVEAMLETGASHKRPTSVLGRRAWTKEEEAELMEVMKQHPVMDASIRNSICKELSRKFVRTPKAIGVRMYAIEQR